MKQTISKSKSKKGRKGRKNIVSLHQKRRKEDRRQHARGVRILQARKERGGGVVSRRNNRISESATKGRKEAKRKAKKDTKNKRKTRLKDKTITKTRKGNTENDKKERKNKGKERKKRKKGKGRGKWQGCPGGTALLITWVSTGEANHFDDGRTQASVCWADRLLPPYSCVTCPPQTAV